MQNVSNSELPQVPSTPTSDSSNSLLGFDLNFLEAPVKALMSLPKDQMTDEQLRAAVQRVRQLRTVAPSFRAMLEKENQEPSETRETKVSEALKGFGAL